MTAMEDQKAEVVICGAGIAGVSAAYFLTARQGMQRVMLVDENAPLSLTSDNSTECYRNWWPGPGDAMVGLMNRSIDLMEELAEESGNIFHLNRRGYLYCTGDPERVTEMRKSAETTANLGAGPLRVHTGKEEPSGYIPAEAEGFKGQPTGADLLLDPGLIRAHFPYLTRQVAAALHVRRAGWFSAQQLGMYLLQGAREHGTKLVEGKVSEVEVSDGQVCGVRLADGRRITTRNFVNAAGPYLKEVGALLGVELPVYNELHLKVAMKDPLGVLDRSAPLVIWSDTQKLEWSSEEQQILTEDDTLGWMLSVLPAGVHTRPEGAPEGQMILVLWEHQDRPMPPVYPIPLDQQYADIALRGLVKMIPGMQTYVEKPPRPRIDGGYYTKTAENRPLIGQLPVRGAYLIGALSGFGVMSSCAAGDLLAAHVTGNPLPPYAAAFSLERYQDPAYLQAFEDWQDSGQL